MVDHHKKAGMVCNVIDDILGSTGKAAVIDTAWGLYKERGKRGATLRVTGRDIKACELALEFDGLRSRWELNQDLRQEEARSTAEQEVYDVLAEAGEADAGVLAQRLGKHRITVRDALKRLEAKGQVASREEPAGRQRGKRVVFYVQVTDAPYSAETEE